MMGRFDEATAQVRYAGELDPMNPINRNYLASIALDSHQGPDLAIEEFKNIGDDIGLGVAYGQKKMYLDAAAAFSKGCKPKEAGAVCSVETCLGEWSRREEERGNQVD